MEFEVVGVFQSFSRDFDARAVRIPIAAAQELLGGNGINALVVSLRQTADTERVAAALRPQLAATGFELRTWVQLNDFYEKTIDLYKQQFGFLQLIILIMVLLSVANSVNMSIFERVGEFGTMMAVGDKRRDVFRLIVTESAVIGVAGSILGAVLGVALAAMISKIGIPMPPPPSSNIGYLAAIRILPLEVLSAMLIGTAATTCAAILPAARVVKIPVVDALRQWV
jgi:putative ABC transport system permease protein